MSDNNNNLQDLFLNTLRKNKTPVTMFLVKGVKLQGIVTWFDNFSLLLRRDNQMQLVYKHAISTIMPAQRIDFPVATDEDKRGAASRRLQDVFLAASQDSRVPVTMFLINGVMLQGVMPAYDLFCILLEREGMLQLVYKHAISTIQTDRPVNLADYSPGEDA